MKALDGKSCSQTVLTRLKDEILKNTSKGLRSPRLDMILVGDDFASQKYVSMKEKRAVEIGVQSVIHRMSESSTTEDLITKIRELNSYDGVDGFMVQLPLPKQIDEGSVLDEIDIRKDIDGLTAKSLGLLFQNQDYGFASATPKGIMLLLDDYEIDVAGKNVVVIGRSRIVGLPMFALMNNANATVTLLHSRSVSIEETCSKADILISAVGKPGFVTPDFVKDGAIVIDVGTNRDPLTGNLVGDVQYETVAPKTSYITPVPGGVGPMTIAALLWNTVQAWRKR